MEKRYNVLSLFDGIACGYEALKKCGIPVNTYYASEIDKYAILVAQKNHSDIIELGDINDWKNWNRYDAISDGWGSIDLVIGGSPCQGFSVAGKHLNFDDPRSKLFFKYVEILNHIKKYNPNVKFLLENVKMKKEYEDGISELLGVEPVSIDSSLLSAQSRKRLYWTNIPNVTIPEDKHIMLQDILLENTYTEANKSYCIDACYVKGTLSDYLKRGRRQHVCQILEEYIVPIDKTLVVLEKEVQEGKLGYFRKDSQANRVYYPTQKGITLCGEAGGGCAKMGQYFFGEVIKDFKGLDLSQYVHPCFILKTDKGNDVLLAGYIRKLTPEECERLQTLDDGYTSVIPKTQRYKCLGNGWTVDVVAHILKGLKQEG